ncbi:hypothetical protein SLE2022_122870 [Rubroshorea leprosula]
MTSKQMTGNTEPEKEKNSGLPMETSPYLKYKDVEDYKLNAYGTQGHLPVKPGKDGGGGGTDAPTLSGSDSAEAKAISE